MHKARVIIRSILFFTFSVWFSNIYSATYYISNSGDDSNNGLSPVYPVKSIYKLNSIISKMKPGDAVFFERDGIYYGQINLNASGSESRSLIIGAYGNGKNPVISGSVPIRNWDNYKGKIYKTYFDGTVKNLFLNRKQMVLARYPNSGFLEIEKPFPDKKSGFTNKNLKNFDGYWNGSNVRIRTENWAYEYTPVKDFKNGSLTFLNKTYYQLQSGSGFYLDNNLNELDSELEWIFIKGKKGGGDVYFYPPQLRNIDDYNIEGSVYDNGIFSLHDLKNITIRDLVFRNQAFTGVYFARNVSNLSIENCNFEGQEQMGIYLTGICSEIKITDCRFDEINGKALYFLNTSDSEVNGSVFTNIGMIPGYGTTSDAFPMSGIVMFGNNNRITRNYFNMTGHNPVNTGGENYVIEKNIIKNSLLLLNDGGAIKCYGENSRNSIWRNNFISNVKGNISYYAADYKGIIAHGIYLDEKSNNIKILNNTISGCGFAAIGLNAANNNTLEYNICADNFTGLNFFQNDLYCRSNIINYNLISSDSEDQFSAAVQSLKFNNVPGSFSGNYYFSPENILSFRILEHNIAYDYSFDEWKEFVGSDSKSVFVTDKEWRFSKIISNMSDDTVTYLLKTGNNYRNKNLNSVLSSIKLNPWSSDVLFSDRDLSKEPDLSASGGPVSFGKPSERGSSIIMWYNLSGENLKDQVTITAPNGFEISRKYDSGFSASLKFIPENGKTEEIIFVMFVPDQDKGYYDFISNKSGSLEAKIKVSGNSR